MSEAGGKQECGRGCVLGKCPEVFGGHTALLGRGVSQPYRTGQRRDDGTARLLLDRGAHPNARASLRTRLRFVDDEALHEYRDVTPIKWASASMIKR